MPSRKRPIPPMREMIMSVRMEQLDERKRKEG
jgi:hypothetical protein